MFMLCQVALHCLVLRISVPSLTLCCSVHLTKKRLELRLSSWVEISVLKVWPLKAERRRHAPGWWRDTVFSRRSSLVSYVDVFCSVLSVACRLASLTSQSRLRPVSFSSPTAPPSPLIALHPHCHLQPFRLCHPSLHCLDNGGISLWLLRICRGQKHFSDQKRTQAVNLD